MNNKSKENEEKKVLMYYGVGRTGGNKMKNTPAHKSESPTKLINVKHKELVQLLQKLAIKKKSKLESTTLKDIYLNYIGFSDILPEELQSKLDKAVNEAMKDLLDHMCPGYFITDEKEKIAERMFKWIVGNLEVSDIWEGQQKFLKEHNINEYKLSFNSEIFKKYNKAVVILRNKLIVYKEEIVRIQSEKEENPFAGIYYDSKTKKAYKEKDGKKIWL